MGMESITLLLLWHQVTAKSVTHTFLGRCQLVSRMLPINSLGVKRKKDSSVCQYSLGLAWFSFKQILAITIFFKNAKLFRDHWRPEATEDEFLELQPNSAQLHVRLMAPKLREQLERLSAFVRPLGGG